MTGGSRAPRQSAHLAPRAGLIITFALTIGASLALPYLLITLLGGAVVRTAYPAYVLAVSCLIIRSHRPLYPAFMIAVFAFSPFLRRIADYQAGFAVFNLILLAPYVGLLPTLASLLRWPLNGRVMGWSFAMIFGCIVYASLLAMFRLAFVPAVYEAARWLLPVTLCVFVIERPDEVASIRRSLLTTLCFVLPILTAYGIYQYIYAPLWDVFWLANIDNPTFGEGAAYKIRVFSMMNSPGTVGVFSALAMVLLAGDSAIGMAVAVLALPLLALTVVRTGWLALAAGLAIVFWKTSGAGRLALAVGIMLGGVGMTILLASSASSPDIRNLVADRLATFSELSTDKSADDRLAVYNSFFERLSDSPWGAGFGVNESMVTRQETRGNVSSIDSGLLEAYLIFGVLVGTIYFITMAALVREGWRTLARLPSRFSGHAGVLGAVVATLPFGSTQIGEGGVLIWTVFGLLIGADLQRMRNAGIPASE